MTNNKESLNDFFKSIGGEKKKLKEEKKKIIGDLSLDNLFSSMEAESRKIEEEKKQLKKDVEAFKNILFNEEPKKEKKIEKPKVEKEVEEIATEEVEDSIVDNAVKILDVISEEVETIKTEPDLEKLRKEIEVLKQVVYEQGGGGEVRLEFLDDVDRDSVKVDGKFLKYQSSTGKFIGADASGSGAVGAAGTWAVDSVGINTSKSVGIGADAVSGIKLNVAGKIQLENQIKLRSDDGSPARIDLYCESNNAHYLRLQAPAHSAFSGNPTVVLPNTAGTIALTSSNITGTSAGLSGTPNISVGTISGTTITGSSISVANVTASGVSTFTNNIQLKSGDGDPARVDFYCESGNSHYTRLKSAPHSEYSGNVSIVLPIKSGDVIVGDTSGNITQNINTSGIITATSFIGNITGNVTGTATGLTGTPSISVVDIASRHINSSGVVTATSFVGDGSGLTNVTGAGSTDRFNTPVDFNKGINITGVTTGLNVSGVGTIGTLQVTNATISGNLSVGGTLTYEDVTSIDSVGLITARNGMVVSGVSTFLGSQKGVNVVGVSTFAGAINANGGVTGDLTGDVTGDLTGDVTGNVTGNVSGTSGSTTGNAATATKLATARTIGGVSFDGSANINLPGVNASGNQDTSGNASTATVATNAQGLTGTPNVAVGNITVTGDLTVEGTTNSQTSTDTTVTGILTATSLNVGSTATGIGVTLNQGGGVYSGIITASSFTGDGSGLTGVASTDNINTSTPATMASINATGIVTASGGFVGNVTGTLTGASAIVGSAVTITSDGIDAGTTIVTAKKFSGNTAQGGGNDSVFQMNGMTVTQDYEFPDDQSAVSVGPITINSGVEVTVPDGQNWVIL